MLGAHPESTERREARLRNAWAGLGSNNDLGINVLAKCLRRSAAGCNYLQGQPRDVAAKCNETQFTEPDRYSDSYSKEEGSETRSPR